MKGTILIFGGDKKKRITYIEALVGEKEQGLVETPDIMIVGPQNKKKSIGIDSARQLKKFFNERPYSSESKTAVILEASTLTLQAQNALLKTLEEPPEYAVIILETSHKNSLIETVRSRCQLINLQQNEREKDTQEERSLSDKWLKMKNLRPGQKLDLAEKYSKKDRTDVGRAIDTWINEERNLLKEAKNTEKAKIHLKNLKILSQIGEDLKNTNVHLGLALDYLFLSLE